MGIVLPRDRRARPNRVEARGPRLSFPKQSRAQSRKTGFHKLRKRSCFPYVRRHVYRRFDPEPTFGYLGGNRERGRPSGKNFESALRPHYIDAGDFCFVQSRALVLIVDRRTIIAARPKP
jgi:hypothetical protein